MHWSQPHYLHKRLLKRGQVSQAGFAAGPTWLHRWCKTWQPSCVYVGQTLGEDQYSGNTLGTLLLICRRTDACERECANKPVFTIDVCPLSSPFSTSIHPFQCHTILHAPICSDYMSKTWWQISEVAIPTLSLSTAIGCCEWQGVGAQIWESTPWPCHGLVTPITCHSIHWFRQVTDLTADAITLTL